MPKRPVSYKRHRFPAEIITHAVWLYHRFLLSFRDVEELLAATVDFLRAGPCVGNTASSVVLQTRRAPLQRRGHRFASRRW